MKKKSYLYFLGLLSLACLPTCQSLAQTIVAREDFDGGDINLTSGFDPATQNLVELPFTRFGVYQLDEFNTANPAPFALVDDTNVDVSSGGEGQPFPADREGIFGENRIVTDSFFAVASASTFTYDPSQLMGSWNFDTSSATEPMRLQIDMGQLSNDAFNGVNPANFVLFEYRFNNSGAYQTAFSLTPVELVGSGFIYRLLDNGNDAAIDFDGSGSHLGLQATGTGVTKTLADTGAVATLNILDKTPAAGTGAGMMDTYSVDLAGSGNALEIRMSADFGFEAFAFDNICVVTGNTKFLLGDVNCDGNVDLLDVAPFVDRVSTGQFLDKADINMDGAVDLLDVAPFVALLTGS